MSKSEAKAEYMSSPDLGVSDDATHSVLSKKMQVILTYVIGGIGSAYLWPHLEGVSKGLVILFALLAGMSINNGTVSGRYSRTRYRCSESLKGCRECCCRMEQWMANARDLRREQRDQRRQAFREAKQWMAGPS